MCLALAPSPPSTPYHAVRKVCSGNTTPGVDPLIIAVLHHHAAHKIHVNAVFEGAAGVGGAAVACCPPIPQWASRLRCSSSCVPSPTSTPDPTASQSARSEPKLIAGTTPFWGGSWRQIWARDVAFLHFSQTASLRSHNGPKMLTNHISSEHFSRTARPKGGDLGKTKKCDISGPNVPPGTTPKRGGSCDQSRDLVLGLLDTGGRETVLKGVRMDVEWILRS